MNITESREEILKRIDSIAYKRLRKVMNTLSVFLVFTIGGLILSMSKMAGIEQSSEANQYFGTLMLVPRGGNPMITALLCFVLGCILTSMVFTARDLRRHTK